MKEKKRMDKAEFVRQSIKRHGDRYDYTDTVFEGALNPVTIRCPIHGEFSKSKAFFHYNYKRGSGCPKCANDRFRKTTQQFIKDAIEIHGNRYSYEKTNYVRAADKVIITCPEHGDFEVIASSHIRMECGCQKCAGEHGFQVSKPGYLYLLLFEKDGNRQWKIGITNRSVDSRFAGDAHKIVYRHTWFFSNGVLARKSEKSVLKKFASYRLKKNELSVLNGGGKTECFSGDLPVTKVIQFISSMKYKGEVHSVGFTPSADELHLLDTLSQSTGLSYSEILRWGLNTLATTNLLS